MPKQVTIQIQVSSPETVTATKYIKRVFIVADEQIYWEIDTVYNEEVVRSQYYNWPFIDLAQNYFPQGVTFEAEFEKALFEQSDIIDQMPQGTEEEKASKNARYGTGIGTITPVRIESII